MQVFKYTILGDGSSDSVLKPIVDWLFTEHVPGLRVLGTFAQGLGNVGNTLEARVRAAAEYFPSDLLLIHRDTEGVPREQRLAEIASVKILRDVVHVAVITDRMTEAWLFSSEEAIRFAAENASGSHAIGLPKKKQWEKMPDPKQELFNVLRRASGKTGRALAKFHPEKARHLITARTASFHPLRGLASFDAFESDLAHQLKKYTYALD